MTCPPTIRISPNIQAAEATLTPFTLTSSTNAGPRASTRRIASQDIEADARCFACNGCHGVVDHGHDAFAFGTEQQRLIEDLFDVDMPEYRPITAPVGAGRPVHWVFPTHVIEQRVKGIGAEQARTIQLVMDIDHGLLSGSPAGANHGL